MENEATIHVKVPRELHTSVKIRAAEAGLTINDYVSNKLAEATKRIKDKPLREPKAIAPLKVEQPTVSEPCSRHHVSKSTCRCP